MVLTNNLETVHIEGNVILFFVAKTLIKMQSSVLVITGNYLFKMLVVICTMRAFSWQNVDILDTLFRLYTTM